MPDQEGLIAATGRDRSVRPRLEQGLTLGRQSAAQLDDIESSGRVSREGHGRVGAIRRIARHPRQWRQVGEMPAIDAVQDDGAGKTSIMPSAWGEPCNAIVR